MIWLYGDGFSRNTKVKILFCSFFSETKLFIGDQPYKKKSTIFIDLTKKVKYLKNKMYFEGLTNYGVKEITNQGNKLNDDNMLIKKGIKSHDELDFQAYTGRYMVTLCVEWNKISSP